MRQLEADSQEYPLLAPLRPRAFALISSAPSNLPASPYLGSQPITEASNGATTTIRAAANVVVVGAWHSAQVSTPAKRLLAVKAPNGAPCLPKEGRTMLVGCSPETDAAAPPPYAAAA
jgi:hypothetical protein